MPSLNLQDYLLAGACGLAALAVVFAVVQSARVDRLKDDVAAAEARELGAKIQATLNAAVLKIEDRRHTIETRIVEVANDEAAALAQDSRGDTPVDPGLLADWRRGLERVRQASAASPHPDPGEPSGEVSPP